MTSLNDTIALIPDWSISQRITPWMNLSYSSNPARFRTKVGKKQKFVVAIKHDPQKDQ